MKQKIVIIDYGMGNLYSVYKALAAVGAEVEVTSQAQKILQADKVVLPGVGAFGDCMANLAKYQLLPVLQEVLAGEKPFLGICLGLQLLFEGSEEAPGIAGLGYFKGQVKKIPTDLKIPHMGWNSLELVKPSPLLQQAAGAYVYFVHSFHAVPTDASIITATCDYNTKVTAAVGRGHVQAMQFHPEKSSAAGLSILKAFKEWS